MLARFDPRSFKRGRKKRAEKRGKDLTKLRVLLALLIQ